MIGRVAVVTALVACGGGSSSAPASTEPSATAAPAPDARPDDAEVRDQLVDLCARSMKAMGEDPEDLQTAMANVMLSCSQACDLDSRPSCDHLDEFMQITCGAVVSICDGMCSDETKSPSLNRAACAHASTP